MADSFSAQWTSATGSGIWNQTFGRWEADGSDVVIRSGCRMECVIGGAGSFDVRISFNGLLGPQRIGVELDDVFLTVGGEGLPGLKIELANRVLAATALGMVRGENPGEFFCERDGGVLRMSAPGGIILEVPDPSPRLPVRALALYLPEGTRFTSLTLEAQNFVPASAPITPVRKLDLSVCIDFFDDLIFGAWTEETFRQCMVYFRKNGFRRVYFLDHFGREGGWWKHAGENPRFPGHQEFIDQTFRNVGDYLPAAVRAAKAEGLEVIAVLKPFETAMFHSTPTPPDQAHSHGGIRSLGGWNRWSTDFAAANPNMRLERNMTGVPPDLAGKKIATIVLTAQAGLAANIDPTLLRFWTSEDNGAYAQIPADTLSVRWDTGEKGRLIIKGLNEDRRFFAVTYEGTGKPVFGNTFDELIQIFDSEGHRLPVTFSTVPNPPGRKFTETGFVMDAVGCGNDIFWMDGGGPLGVAIGVERFLQGALCPVYPEVRQWWIDQVHQCLAAGVDGVDFRVSSHNRTFHWEAYGFNRPIVEAFRMRHGIDILSEPFDRKDLRILIGEYYTDFLREARSVINAAEKSMHLHIELGFQEADQDSDLEIFFPWRRWLDEGLADEVCVKNIRCMESPFAQEIAAHARAAGVGKVHFNPSMNMLTGHPAPREFFDYVIRDTLAGGADGFILYETWAVLAACADGSINVTMPWVVEALSAHASECVSSEIRVNRYIESPS